LANAGYATKGKRASREEMGKVAKGVEVKANIEQVKAKMADTSKEYVPVPVESDPWTIQVAPPTQTIEQAVEMVKDALGGTPANESCRHGARVWKTGQQKSGKSWGHWRCPESGHPMSDPCDPIWYEIAKDGTWQPQVKRG
jgi:hypothetical protein